MPLHRGLSGKTGKSQPAQQLLQSSGDAVFYSAFFREQTP
jgi:hypothetical protein